MQRRLTRSMIDRALGGVSGGLGAYLGISAWWVRLAFVVFALFNLPVALILYLLLWLALPQQSLGDLPPGDPAQQARVSAETLILLGLSVVIFGMIVLAVSLDVFAGTSGNVLLSFVVISLGIVMLAQQLRKTA